MAKEQRDVRLLIFAGSLREQSLNDRLAGLAAACVTKNGSFADRAAISDFDAPHYDHDVETETGIPLGVQAFADRLKAADGLIMASPEYNASMPGVVKNLIDWASRIRPQPFNGKQALLMSASPSMVGGNRGLWSLRIPLEHLGIRKARIDPTPDVGHDPFLVDVAGVSRAPRVDCPGPALVSTPDGSAYGPHASPTDPSKDLS